MCNINHINHGLFLLGTKNNKYDWYATIENFYSVGLKMWKKRKEDCSYWVSHENRVQNCAFLVTNVTKNSIRPQFALSWPKIYTCSPVGAHIKKLILDPGGPVLPIPMILLPLCPETLILKHPQRHKIIHEMHPLGHKKRFFGRISCSCDFCDCCLKMHI